MNAIETPDDDRYDDDRFGAERSAEAFESDTLPSTGLLSFYDRLRGRVTAWFEQRGGQPGSAAGEVLMLVPDVFFLLARLSLDRDIPKSTRALFASTLAYFVLPFDLLPEAVSGVPGYVDDLILAGGVLVQALGRDLEDVAEKHWSGSQSLRRGLADTLETARGLAGTSLYSRLRTLLAKRGIELDELTEAELDRIEIDDPR